MSTISDIIAQVRMEISDKNTARWTDTDMIRWIRKAVTMISGIMYRAGAPLARTSTTITTVDGQATYSLPADFGTMYSVTRSGSPGQLTQQTEEAWRSSGSSWPSMVAYGIVIESGATKLFISGTPYGGETLTISYYPNIDTSGYGLATTSPWSGRLDYQIADYVRICTMNADEQAVTADAELTKAWERSVLVMLSGNEGTNIPFCGWNF